MSITANGALATPDAQVISLMQQPELPKFNAKKPMSAEKMDATAKDFEAQFISQMLSSMFSTVETANALGGSETEETYRSFMINEYGKTIARTGGIGIADQIKRSMLSMQEVKS